MIASAPISPTSASSHELSLSAAQVAASDLPREHDQRSPLRKCLGTGQVLPKEALLRFVVAPDGSLMADLAGKLPGRGLWVSAQAGAIESALKTKSFNRSAKQQLKISSDFRLQLHRQLERAIVQRLGLLRKSGELTLGFEKVKANLKSSKPYIFAAKDFSTDSQAKLKAPIDLVLPIVGETLGQALSRAVTMIMALKRVPQSQKVFQQLSLWAQALESLQQNDSPAKPSPSSGAGPNSDLDEADHQSRPNQPKLIR